MADTKITALTAISTNPVNPATFPIPMVDLLDTSMAASGTTKKVTVNQILGSGGTAILASATITGDLTVRTTRLATTTTGVGIGTASPIVPLDVRGSSGAGALFLRTTDPTSAVSSAYIQTPVSTGFSALVPIYGFWYQNCGMGNPASDAVTLITASTERYRIDSAGTNTWSNVGGAGTAMTLNSTGLGIGDAPATNSRLTIGSTNATGFQYALRTTGITTGRCQIYLNNTSGDFLGGIESSVAGTSISGTAAYSGYVGTSTTNPFHIVTNGSVKATVDSSGNVGIGVTPNTWSAGYKFLMLPNGGSLFNDTSNGIYLGANYYALAGSKKIASGYALNYLLDATAGAYKWFTSTAGAGTAGDAVSLTQAMTLDASGNLLVGTTSGSFGSRLIISADSGTTKWASGPLAAAPTNYYVTANNTQGVFLNGTSATAWTAISDERFKDIIEPISNAIAKVGLLRSVIGKFKTDVEGTRRAFLIAQDVLAAFPEAAVATNPDKLAVTYTEVIPLLVAAIKELTARVQTLEAR